MYFARVFLLALSGVAVAVPALKRQTCDVPSVLDNFRSEVSSVLGQLGQLYYSGQATVQDFTDGFNEIIEDAVEAQQEIEDNCSSSERRSLEARQSGDLDSLIQGAESLVNEAGDVLEGQGSSLFSKLKSAVDSLQSSVSGHSTPSKRQSCNIPSTLSSYKSGVSGYIAQIAQQYYSGTATISSINTAFNNIILLTTQAKSTVSTNCRNARRSLEARTDAQVTVDGVSADVGDLLDKVGGILGSTTDDLRNTINNALQSLQNTTVSAGASADVN